MTIWQRLGIERSFGSASELLGVVGRIVSDGRNRYVWRGQKDVCWTMRSSLHRRFLLGSSSFDEPSIVRAEAALLRAARAAGYGRFGGREMNDVELLALLQHEGAATRFIDVTPDPFIALFFACEGAAAQPNQSAALVAMRIDARQVVTEPIPEGVSGESVLEQVRAAHAAAGHSPINENLLLWQPPPLSERIKVQRGMFIIGALPGETDVHEYASVDFRLLRDGSGKPDKATEKARVNKVCDPTQGRYPKDGRPRLMVLRISPTIRRELQRILEERFGYRTESIYPDLNGFARANAQDVVLRPDAARRTAAGDARAPSTEAAPVLT